MENISMRLNELPEVFGICGEKYLKGYACRFYDGTSETEGNGGKYTIRIQSTAFDKVLNDENVQLRFNHSREFTLGNRATGLEITKDAKGISYAHKFDASDPDFQRVECKMRKNLITGSSWQGMANGKLTSENGKQIYTITEVAKFEDVGPCDKPACMGTGKPVIMSADNELDLAAEEKAWEETKKRIASL